MEDYNNSKDDALEGKDNCEKEKDSIITCEKTVHQKTKVSLPISVEPFVIPGRVRARCCGTAKVTIEPFNECKENCNYVITQEICIEIPLKFGVSTEIKDSFIECEAPSIEDTCSD
jgi:hypothetical protein